MQITTLIPAYKTKYIDDLLGSLQEQTHPPLKVIISDDSPKGAFREALYAGPHAKALEKLDVAFHEGPRTGAADNIRQLLKLWDGSTELFHIMLDDDVLYPEFYERHLVAHLSGTFSCSISRRWTATEQGRPIGSLPIPDVVANNMNRMVELGPEVLFMTTVPECKNWFGEFSNAVYRASCGPLLAHPQLASISYVGLWDLGSFLAASIENPVCYIQDYLGSFRTSPDQNSAQTFGVGMKSAVLSYVTLALGGRRLGRFTDEQLVKCLEVLASVMNAYYGTQDDMRSFCALMGGLIARDPVAEEQFLLEWKKFLAANRLDF